MSRAEKVAMLTERPPYDFYILTYATIRRMKDGKTQTGRTSARENAAGAGYAALAAAHSRAVARLSQDLAAATNALERTGP